MGGSYEWDSKTAVHFTFAAHSGADSILFNKWMVDFRRSGPLAHVRAPYDWVLATTGAEEVGEFETAEEYAAALGGGLGAGMGRMRNSGV